MKRLIGITALLFPAACAREQTGFPDTDEFVARTDRGKIDRTKSATAPAARFRNRALLLPGSTLMADQVGQGAT